MNDPIHLEYNLSVDLQSNNFRNNKCEMEIIKINQNVKNKLHTFFIRFGLLN